MQFYDCQSDKIGRLVMEKVWKNMTPILLVEGGTVTNTWDRSSVQYTKQESVDFPWPGNSTTRLGQQKGIEYVR